MREAGSDWRTWRVLDLETRKLLPDELKWIKSCCAAWTHDGRGFFCDAPVLIRIESRAGHGSSTPTSKLIAKAADELAFLVKNLGM